MRAFDKYEKLGAYHFDWYNDPHYAWYKVCVDRIVKFCKGSTVDVGGGDGLVAAKIIQAGYDAMVIDNNDNALCFCELESIPYQKYDLEHPADDHTIKEYLVCLNVIEHLKDPSIIVKLIKHCITKGAIIITDKPTGNLGRYHEHEYTKKELIDTFKEFKPKYFEIHSTEHGEPITFHGVEITK